MATLDADSALQNITHDQPIKIGPYMGLLNVMRRLSNVFSVQTNREELMRVRTVLNKFENYDLKKLLFLTHSTSSTVERA